MNAESARATADGVLAAEVPVPITLVYVALVARRLFSAQDTAS
jgi:hypothetical protein